MSSDRDAISPQHVQQRLLRNFCIIAHIDHGKSTLADRMLEMTGTVSEREQREQFLDQMELERERGITIKSQAVRLGYTAQDGQAYVLNLIDTPGHVDFTYEVSRSLTACEGALLVVDAAQGVEAQTVANLYLALDHELEIIPVINKIDLPGARPDEVKAELIDYGFDPDDALEISAKEGTGVHEVLEAVVKRIPPPGGSASAPLKALIFDSHYDAYRGAIAYLRVMSGQLEPGQDVITMASGRCFQVEDVGYFDPEPVASSRLGTGEVGFMAAGMKNVRDCRVGDTITDADEPVSDPLPGYRPVKPMVFAGLYPTDTGDFNDLGDALERLRLNDAALSFEPEKSQALGPGFRVGFLGLLHLEIVQERLEREYGLDLITTAPSVVYRVLTDHGEVLEIDNPSALPPLGEVEAIEEPFVQLQVTAPGEHVGPVMELAEERRGRYQDMVYQTQERVRLVYRIPLADIMFDFFDQLKSRTRGYATMDYEPDGYEVSDLVRLDIRVNEDVVDALSVIVHRSKAESRGRDIIKKLKERIPRQVFKVPLQAAVGSRVIAREDIPARRKDVLSKCYGGDVTRKRKLLEKQKEGKKRMKQVGQVEIPQEAFMAVLEVNDD